MRTTDVCVSVHWDWRTRCVCHKQAYRQPRWLPFNGAQPLWLCLHCIKTPIHRILTCTGAAASASAATTALLLPSSRQRQHPCRQSTNQQQAANGPIKTALWAPYKNLQDTNQQNSIPINRTACCTTSRCCCKPTDRTAPSRGITLLQKRFGCCESHIGNTQVRCGPQ